VRECRLANSKKHSAIKSLRITKELGDYLKDEAEKSNTTVSALISSILTSYQDRYSQFDKLRGRYDPISLKRVEKD
jgi:hypothetical protein